MREVNDHWIATHPDPGDNDWRRATYFIGDVTAAAALHEPRYFEYAERWATAHHYRLHTEAFMPATYTFNADDHAAAQVYLELYNRGPDPQKLEDTVTAIDYAIAHHRSQWSWIDAQFMASPVFARLGRFDAMAERYNASLSLFDKTTGLWFRDANYVGKPILWSRGNGWVMGALVRTLEYLPVANRYRASYEDMLRTMAKAVAARQRSDGLWNVNLANPDDYAGPEASGTALFIYAIAWGINHQILDREAFAPVVERGWRGLVTVAVRSDGELGYVQGVGEAPSSAQPVTLRSTADYGVGAFLLAGAEVMKLDLDLGCNR